MFHDLYEHVARWVGHYVPDDVCAIEVSQVRTRDEVTLTLAMPYWVAALAAYTHHVKTALLLSYGERRGIDTVEVYGLAASPG